MTNEGSGLSEVPCKYCGAKEYIWWARHCSNPDGHAAWQNAAESLPVQPEQESCQHCGLPIRKTGMDRVRNEWEHLDGMSYCKGASTYAWPIAPVEAKEKEQCPNCNHKAHFALRCGALIATGSGQEWDGDIFCECLNWVAEPKLTPSASIESRKDVVVAASRCIRHWHDTDNGGMVVSGEHVRQLWDAIAQLDAAKPQPDSSSIPDGQTFEQWWASYQPIRTIGFADYISCARAAWSAAKGQSNGR